MNYLNNGNKINNTNKGNYGNKNNSNTQSLKNNKTTNILISTIQNKNPILKDFFFYYNFGLWKVYTAGLLMGSDPQEGDFVRYDLFVMKIKYPFYWELIVFLKGDFSF